MTLHSPEGNPVTLILIRALTSAVHVLGVSLGLATEPAACGQTRMFLYLRQAFHKEKKMIASGWK
jgi:hypothetical protein